MVVTSYLSGGNVLRISYHGGRLIDLSYGQLMVLLVVLGSHWAGMIMSNLLTALQVNLGWPLSVPYVIPFLGEFLPMTVHP